MKLSRRAMLGGALAVPAFARAADVALPDERVRGLIAAAARFAASPAAQLWPGYAAQSFELLLIDGERELLFFRDAPVAGFEPAGRDPVTGSTVQTRARKFAPNLLATFPAVSATPAIVVGTPEAAGRSPAAWAVTLLHEHFHQLQYASAGYQARMDALGLANGDQTGMWMLNYPFPYAAAAPAAARAAASLAAAIDSAGTPPGRALLARFRRDRAAFRASVPAKDWRYFAFQCWQEGIARHTEIILAERSPHVDWRAVGAAQRRDVMATLRAYDLKRDERVAIYPFGAGEGMLLDRWSQTWRTGYFSGPPSLDAAIAALR